MVKTAILESHPYRPPPAFVRILRYAALELELPPSASALCIASCARKGRLSRWMHRPFPSLTSLTDQSITRVIEVVAARLELELSWPSIVSE
jgi:hypothetical protein